jgi:NAD(P)-dependent dehydrogenase (short-subunit alcohol dehydrogenase family)
MCLELGKHSIRVNSINLGGVWTPMWADSFIEGGTGRQNYEEFVERVIKRIPTGKPFIPMDDVIHTVLFVASSNNTSMLTGASIALDGGYTVT